MSNQPPEYGSSSQPQQPYPQDPYAQQPPNPYAGVPGQYMPVPIPAVPVGTTDPENIDLPLYGATFGQAVRRFFKQYAKFTGRASRSEYWWIALFDILVYLIPTIILLTGTTQIVAWQTANDSYSGAEMSSAPGWGLMMVGMVLTGIVGLALLVPHIALTWRRLHDANLAGPFYFLTFIPSVGSIVLLVMTLLPSNPAGMRFDVRQY